MKLTQNWMFALFMIPIISVMMIGIAFFGVYPFLSETNWGGVVAVKMITMVLGLAIPGVTSLFFKVDSFFVAAIWIGFTGLAFFLDRGNTYASNQSTDLFAYFFAFQMLATAFSTILIAMQLNKVEKQEKS